MFSQLEEGKKSPNWGDHYLTSTCFYNCQELAATAVSDGNGNCCSKKAL